MRTSLKRFLRRLGLTGFARSARKGFYCLFDAAGYALFAFVRAPEFRPEQVRKILIIRTDRVGDLVLSTPAIRAVRRAYPGAVIHLLVSDYTRDLVAGNPHVNKVLTRPGETLSGDYDLAIALHPGFRQNYIAYRSGARWRIGYSGWGGGFFLTRRLKDDRAVRVRHEVVSALEAVAAAGCAADDPPELEISLLPEGERCADEFFRGNNLTGNHPIVALHPGSRQPYIRWAKEGFAAVADTLIAEKRASVILIGGIAENALLDDVAALMQRKPVIARGLPLAGLVSVLRRCHLFVGNSTGPLHIAAALKVPTVAIFGSRHPLDSWQEWGPWGKGHTVVSKDPGCPDCHPTDCRTFACLNMITPADVLAAIETTLRQPL